MKFLGDTPSLSNVVVQSTNVLAPGTIETTGSGSNLYEWSKATGLFQSVNILPDGLPEATHSVNLGGRDTPAYGQAIANDGSRVVWTATSAPTALYVREGLGGAEQPRTLQVDAPAGGGEFLTASADDAKIFFADRHPLTADATEGGGGGRGDLYRFEPKAPENERLGDLTPDHIEEEGAEVQGILGASEDGSYLYFVANGVLADNIGAGGEMAQPGDCLTGRSKQEDECNLYLWHEGEGTRFIARLSEKDESNANVNFNGLGVAFDWDDDLGKRTTRVSSDGTKLVFMSERSLTGYDNIVTNKVSCGIAEGRPFPAPCQEVYLYEAVSGRLTCVSCNPDGAPPIGPSSIPGATEFSLKLGQYQSRMLSDDGVNNRVFFDSADALVPEDSNGVEDVYEYENGRDYLLSDGSSSAGATFVDASTNGDDVFFITRAQLVPQDTDQSVDLYDARAPHEPGEAVGFPPPQAPPPCEGEDCRPAPPSAPVSSPLSSVLFTGLGNAPAAAPQPATKPKAKRSKPKPKARKPKKKVKRRKRASLVVVKKSAKGKS